MSLGEFLNGDVTTVAPRLWRAVAWWLDELAAMAAPLVARTWRGDGGSTAERRADGSYRVRGPDGIERPVASGGPRPAAALLLPSDSVLRRSMPAPPLPARDVRRMIALDLDRLTPFTAERVYHAIEVTPAKQKGALGQAHLAVVTRAEADDAIAAAERAGVDVTAVLAADRATPAVDFLPAWRAAHADPARVRRVAVAWTAAAMLLALDLALCVGRDMANVAALRAQLDAQRPVVARILTLRREVQDRAAQARTRAQARLRTDPLRVFDGLARGLPDGAWVQRLAFDGAAVHLAGSRSEGVDVAGALAAEPIFAKVADSEPGAAANVFDVAADVRAPPAPGVKGG